MIATLPSIGLINIRTYALAYTYYLAHSHTAYHRGPASLAVQNISKSNSRLVVSSRLTVTSIPIPIPIPIPNFYVSILFQFPFQFQFQFQTSMFLSYSNSHSNSNSKLLFFQILFRFPFQLQFQTPIFILDPISIPISNTIPISISIQIVTLALRLITAVIMAISN